MRRLIVKATVGSCALLSFFDLIGHPAQVVGSSMYPTLHGEDSRWYKRDFVWLSTWNLYECSPGTILTFTSPRDPDATFIKRITATEGAIVRPERRPELITEIPKGHYWMEGDNSANRNDSNVFGPVSSSLVKGRATHVIWPPTRWRRL